MNFLRKLFNPTKQESRAVENPRSTAAKPQEGSTQVTWDQAIDQVVDMLVDLYRPYPQGIHSGTPAAQKVKEIGRKLYEAGGMNFMLVAHRRFADKKPELARNLEMRWNGIGEWMG